MPNRYIAGYCKKMLQVVKIKNGLMEMYKRSVVERKAE
jgi:hypothetical protein